MRATPKRFIKSLFLCSVMGFLVINLNLFLRADMDSQGGGTGGVEANQDTGGGGGGLPRTFEFMIPPSNKPQAAGAVAGVGAAEAANETFKRFIEKGNSKERLNVAGLNRTNLRVDFNSSEKLDPKDWLEYREIGTNSADIQAYIKAMNRAQPIRNLDKFDLSTSENTIVIVVQVHNRLDYLQALIESLKKARYIEDALLIFSHDYFDDRLNLLISTVDFCPVLQIFYPNSIQLHPHEYPGEDPDDCPRDMKRDQAMKKSCINAEWPDKYGHYREAKYTQTKHHWFWKLNHVFDFLDVTRNFNGPVLLLEEDHYVAEDFIHVLWKMYRFKEQCENVERACKECSIFTIGSYEKHPTYGSFSNRGLWEFIFGRANKDEDKVDRVEIMNWISSKHNMGMALNREVWQKIKKCTEPFCNFDDYNWDWSLQSISMTCIPNMLRVMVMKSPRIFHIGECGVHHKVKNGKCDPTDKVKQIMQLLASNKDSLYPDSLAIHGFPKTANRKLKPNGGWGDLRDRQMCIRFADKDTHR